LRISAVADYTPHGHTILGFKVADVAVAVTALRKKRFQHLRGVNQNELGIVTLPGGAIREAWLKDTDGNVLSMTNV
jgi:hypothetical protein